MQRNEDMPNWDVAIEAMVLEEHKKEQRPLQMQDFRALAREYDFRLDDIMETVLLMVMHEAWRYQPSDADGIELNHETLVAYCTKKRLSEDDLVVLKGGWQPHAS